MDACRLASGGGGPPTCGPPTPGAAVLCLEVDEGTEHAPVTRDKLEGYAEALKDRPGWHPVFAAGWPERR